MFKGSYQKKLFTILFSGGSNPLESWDIQVKNGWTRRVKDEDMGNIVFEIAGTNVATAFIVIPPEPRATLGISLPFITMFIKNLKRYFTFEIQILDDKQMRRRFRFSNYQSATKVRPFTCSVPLALQPGWNQMQLNLANFTTRAYGTNYLETQRVQIHANCRIRRVYFSDRLYTEEELPREYRVHLDTRSSQSKAKPMEKVASILKKPSLNEQPPAMPTPEDQLGQPSYKTIDGKSATELSHAFNTSMSGTTLVKHPPSLVDSGTEEIELRSEIAKRDSVGSKLSQKSKSSRVAFTASETDRAITGEGKEDPFAATSEEQVVTDNLEESPEEPVTESELSPRTDSEYAESEPGPASDVELTDAPQELAD